VVQIWPGQTVTYVHTNSPGHIWTTLYFVVGLTPFVRSYCDVFLFLGSMHNTCSLFGYIIRCMQMDISCWLVSCAVNVSIGRNRMSELYLLYRVWVSSLEAFKLSDLPSQFCVSDIDCSAWKCREVLLYNECTIIFVIIPDCCRVWRRPSCCIWLRCCRVQLSFNDLVIGSVDKQFNFEMRLPQKYVLFKLGGCLAVLFYKRQIWIL
jgi:hypothetical protein